MSEKPVSTDWNSKRCRPGNGEAAEFGGITADKDESDSLENNIVRLAMDGKLAQAARDAIAVQRALGLPITFKRGDEVIKVHADGRVEVQEKLPKPVHSSQRRQDN